MHRRHGQSIKSEKWIISNRTTAGLVERTLQLWQRLSFSYRTSVVDKVLVRPSETVCGSLGRNTSEVLFQTNPHISLSLFGTLLSFKIDICWRNPTDYCMPSLKSATEEIQEVVP